jgi:isopropylmalate/homocitrate/citramalate synthase
MTRERLYLFDTTLRDGALTTGVDFSLEDKRHIAGVLDELGVDYVEGGYPGANPIDTRFFEKKPSGPAAPPPTTLASRACWPPTPMRSSMSPKPGIITSMSRSAVRSRKISPA